LDTVMSPPAIPSTEAERESAYFDALIEREGGFDPFTPRGWATLGGCFRAAMGPAHDLRLLEVGAGAGASRRLYSERCAFYVGLDLSPAALRRAARAHPDHRWARADALRLPFRAASFDVVAFSSVLHHIEDFGAAVAEGTRVLRPGGCVFAYDPNVFHPAMAVFRHPRSPLYLSAGVSPNERPLRPIVLRAAFENAALVDVRQHCQSDVPYRAVAPRLLNAGLALYNVADRLLERSGLARWLGTFVVTSGRKPPTGDHRGR
jgi:SAM-dependent methyltransferase